MILHILARPQNVDFPPQGENVKVNCGEEIPVGKPMDQITHDQAVCPECLKAERNRPRLPRLNTFLIAEFDDADLTGIACNFPF